jgi:hypothetical protein
VHSRLPLSQVDENTGNLDYAFTFQTDWQRLYQKSIEGLPLSFQVYLWLRKNYVIDILFKSSEKHLQDMLE